MAGAAYLKERGIKGLPVTVVNGEVIIGYNPGRLSGALKLNLRPNLSVAGKAAWLADKWERNLTATLDITRQFSDAQLKQIVPWRAEKDSIGDRLVHMLMRAELAWLSQRSGSLGRKD